MEQEGAGIDGQGGQQELGCWVGLSGQVALENAVGWGVQEEVWQETERHSQDKGRNLPMEVVQAVVGPSKRAQGCRGWGQGQHGKPALPRPPYSGFLHLGPLTPAL